MENKYRNYIELKIANFFFSFFGPLNIFSVVYLSNKQNFLVEDLSDLTVCAPSGLFINEQMTRLYLKNFLSWCT